MCSTTGRCMRPGRTRRRRRDRIRTPPHGRTTAVRRSSPERNGGCSASVFHGQRGGFNSRRSRSGDAMFGPVAGRPRVVRPPHSKFTCLSRRWNRGSVRKWVPIRIRLQSAQPEVAFRVCRALRVGGKPGSNSRVLVNSSMARGYSRFSRDTNPTMLLMISETGSSCRARSASVRASAKRPRLMRTSAYHWCALAYAGRNSIARLYSCSAFSQSNSYVLIRPSDAWASPSSRSSSRAFCACAFASGSTSAGRAVPYSMRMLFESANPA